MKIGVWVNEPLNKFSGGGFTYFNALMAGIDNFDFSPGTEIILLSAYELKGFSKPAINIKPHQREHTILVKAFRKLLKVVSDTLFKNRIRAIDQKEKIIKDSSVAAFLKSQGIKLIFYPLPSSAIINGIPYIVNNWDLAHRATYAFPEIVDDHGFEKRDEWYKQVVPSALQIYCESEAGKKELVQYLNINPEKIRVMPMFCSDAFVTMQVDTSGQQQVLNTLGLEAGKFFFYPAQFWAHKNHYHLVNAFALFNTKYPGYKLLFCGSDKGNIGYIKEQVKTLGLEQNTIFGGFIDNEALFTLYKNAAALVMPTFFGPTNIPPVEALLLQCPVLLSDIEGHREIMQDGALYFNPAEDGSIAESLIAIIDTGKRNQVIQNQTKLAGATPHTIKNALIKLDEHLQEAIKIRSCWE